MFSILASLVASLFLILAFCLAASFGLREGVGLASGDFGVVRRKRHGRVCPAPQGELADTRAVVRTIVSFRWRTFNNARPTPFTDKGRRRFAFHGRLLGGLQGDYLAGLGCFW